MNILSIGGTRPQIVKMAVLIKAFEQYSEASGSQIDHRLLQTSQQYDSQLSKAFFDDLEIPDPHAIVTTHPGAPGMQTASMLASIEASFKTWMPDAVIIYGDTNSTLAAALAASKLQIPLVHIEAGLRSYNRRSQEDINRIVSDHVSDLLLCPTPTAFHQLQAEGLGSRAVFVGDVMLDAAATFATSDRYSAHLRALELEDSEFILATVHHAETTDNLKRLTGVIHAIENLPLPVVLPLHPRVKHMLGTEGLHALTSHPHIHVVDSVSYLEMLILEQSANLILTDSGGVQKEAYFVGTPCVTVCDDTEWPETTRGGWNTLVGTEGCSILAGVRGVRQNLPSILGCPRDLASFGGGTAAVSSVEHICEFLGNA